jgi:hypothetical protein
MNACKHTCTSISAKHFNRLCLCVTQSLATDESRQYR